MEFCSPFCKNGYYGGYPRNEEEFKSLLKNNVKMFVDLTTLKEQNSFQFIYNKNILFTDNLTYINYSIIDNRTPKDNTSFLNLVYYIAKKIKSEDYNVYIHCKGGNGRSSMFICCLLLIIDEIYVKNDINFLFENVKIMHKKRKNLKEKYWYIDCPQVFLQRQYVIEFKENVIKKK